MALFMASKTVSTARSASLRLTLARLTTALTMSSLITQASQPKAELMLDSAPNLVKLRCRRGLPAARRRARRPFGGLETSEEQAGRNGRRCLNPVRAEAVQVLGRNSSVACPCDNDSLYFGGFIRGWLVLRRR